MDLVGDLALGCSSLGIGKSQSVSRSVSGSFVLSSAQESEPELCSEVGSWIWGHLGITFARA